MGIHPVPKGWTNKEIASILHLSEQTARRIQLGTAYSRKKQRLKASIVVE